MANKLWVTEDAVFEKAITEQVAADGSFAAAVGIAAQLTVSLSLTKGGTALVGCSWTPTERSGVPGTYYVVADTATLVTGCAAVAEGTTIYEVWTKTGDVVSRSWPLIVKRQRAGDG